MRTDRLWLLLLGLAVLATVLFLTVSDIKPAPLHSKNQFEKAAEELLESETISCSSDIFYRGNQLKFDIRQIIFENRDGTGKVEITQKPCQVKIMNLKLSEAAELFWQWLADMELFRQCLAGIRVEDFGLVFCFGAQSSPAPNLIVFKNDDQGRAIVNQKTGKVKIVNLKLDEASRGFWQAVEKHFPKSSPQEWR
ncbi:hypothetical protein KKD19_05895 [Patescibacteria group bacterium]|nr:hypothetical protein [Patescibacteria group bacterium]MBU4512736.1 hypothetical protein [Patescibacteria group bacterium]MCG2693076.1 hypothetical protein [Candidatus Parcubacteria bacterium]